ncbi:MAG: efflux RND transporter periplasmic adaptor subunit [Janthinobacterium lividum]
MRPGIAACLGLALLAGCSGAKEAAKPAPKEKEVGVVTLKPERLVFSTELSGRTVSPLIAEIRPQVGGIIKRRLFVEGALVKAGQPLYEIDAAPFQAAYASAQASVRKAESTLAVARTVAKRNAELVKIDAISQQANDTTLATAQQAEADLGVARAAQENARINLGYTRIVSPIAGWIALSAVTPGALVAVGQTTALTTVQQLDPLHVNVTQSSSELLRLKRELARGDLSKGNANAAPVKVLLEDGSAYNHPGKLTFSGVTVDAGTGSVTLRAVVPNPDGLLMPGMYVRTVLEEGIDEKALLVPQQAVTRAPDGSASTLVVGSDNKVARRDIQVGRAIGARWQVLGGLDAGDRVLVEGSQRVAVGDVTKPTEVTIKTGQGAGSAGAPAKAAAATAAPAAAVAPSTAAAAAKPNAPATAAAAPASAAAAQ